MSELLHTHKAPGSNALSPKGPWLPWEGLAVCMSAPWVPLFLPAAHSGARDFKRVPGPVGRFFSLENGEGNGVGTPGVERLEAGKQVKCAFSMGLLQS